jgi:hypothetical protein
MSRQSWILAGLFSLSAFASLAAAPANACTPAPDNPHGCDRINNWPLVRVPQTGGGDDPWPPNCPQCGKSIYDPRAPIEKLVPPNKNLQTQFGSEQMLNPQPLPPKANLLRFR